MDCFNIVYHTAATDYSFFFSFFTFHFFLVSIIFNRSSNSSTSIKKRRKKRSFRTSKFFFWQSEYMIELKIQKSTSQREAWYQPIRTCAISLTYNIRHCDCDRQHQRVEKKFRRNNSMPLIEIVLSISKCDTVDTWSLGTLLKLLFNLIQQQLKMFEIMERKERLDDNLNWVELNTALFTVIQMDQWIDCKKCIQVWLYR